jgi:RHS repeat-associated protein
MWPRRALLAIAVFLAAATVSDRLGFDSLTLPSPRNEAQAASGVLDPFVPNGAMRAASFGVGTPPSNHDFGTGDFTSWSKTGTATIQSGGVDGNYARFDSIGSTLTTAAFTVPANAQTLTFKHVHLASGSNCIFGWILYGPTYTSSTSLDNACGTSTEGWKTQTINVTLRAGESIKLKFQGSPDRGIDTVGLMEVTLPHWDVSGNDDWLPELKTDGPAGNYGRVTNAIVPISEAFTVPANATTLRYARRVAASGGIYNLWARCAPSYNRCNSENTIQGAIILNDDDEPGEWVEKEVYIGDFAGQTIKLEFYNAGVFDWYIGDLVGDPSPSVGSVSIASGAFSHGNVDLSIPGKGIPLEFGRYYSAAPTLNRATEFAPIGYGWTHSYAIRLTFPESDKVTVHFPTSNTTFAKVNNVYTPPPGVYHTLVKNGDNTYTLTTKEDIDYNFSSAGKLTSIVDRNGYTTSLTYDGTTGKLTTVTDAASRTLSFSYTNGRVSEIEDPIGRTVEFGYNSSTGDLTSVTDVKGGTTTYEYDNHQMTSFTDSLDQEHVQSIRDTYGRVVEQADATGGVGCYYYGTGPSYTSSNCPGVSPAPSAGQTIFVDSRGKKTTYDFDSSFRLTQVTTNDGDVGSVTMDSNFNVTCATNPLGKKKSYAYDSKGNVTEVIDENNTDANCGLKSAGVKWTITYTSRNDPDLVTDPRGNKTDYVYDSNGNLTEIQRKDSSDNIKLRTCLTIPTSGNDKGLPTEVIESTTLSECTGNKTLLTYNSHGYVTAVVNARFSAQGSPPQTNLTYDSAGRMLTVTNELSHTTTLTYDNMDKVLTAEDHLGDKVVYTYDAKGKAKTITDANREVSGTAESGSDCGSAGTGDGQDDDSDTVVDDGCPNVIYSYDDNDRLTSVVNAIGGVTSYAYDARGNVVSVTYAKRQAVGAPETGTACGTAGTGNDVDNDSDGTKDDGCPNVIYTYDNLNRLLTQTDALGNVWTLGYDDAGRITSRTDARDLTTSFGYDDKGQLTSIDYPTGTTDVSFQYDAVGNRTQMVDATGTTTYSYDAVNRLTSVTFPGSRTVGYIYSNVGNRATMTYPGGSDQVSYGYDAANNLTAVTDWNSNQTQYAYNNAGMLTTVTLPSGTGIVGTYSYDNADRLTDIDWVKGGSTTIASVTYGLDANGNRKQRVDDYGTSNYGFDALYRLTSVDYPSGTDDTFTYDAVGNRLTRNSTNYTYDAADRLTAVGSTNYGYDDNGNLTSRGSDSFSWDAENRLTSATVNSATTTFAYNGDGLRDSLTFNSNTTTFTWDIAAGIAEVLDDEDFRYVYGLGRISEIGPSTTTRYYLTGALGSVLALVDSSGSVLNTYEYDVFGAVRSSTGSTANPFTFTGEQTDTSTGLEYLRARYYDSATGRFLSLDPLGDGYDYAYDNPVVYTDPSGLRPNAGCASIKSRIDNLSGDSKMVEYWRRVWSGVYAQHCGDGIIAPTESQQSPPPRDRAIGFTDGANGGGGAAAPLDPSDHPEVVVSPYDAEKDRCISGWLDCDKRVGPEMRRKRRGLTELETKDVCRDMLNRCIDRVLRGKEGYFETDLARERMYQLSRSGFWDPFVPPRFFPIPILSSMGTPSCAF